MFPQEVINRLPPKQVKGAAIIDSKIPLMIEAIETALRKKISIQLVETKIAWMFSRYYKLIENPEKGYMIMAKAFKQSMQVASSYSLGHLEVC